MAKNANNSKPDVNSEKKKDPSEKRKKEAEKKKAVTEKKIDEADKKIAQEQDLFVSISDTEKKETPIIISKNNDEIFLIQINKSNLLGYFACALIHPVNYETRELAHSQRTKDIQHFAPDYLLLTNGFADNPLEDQVLLHVIITESDKKELICISDNVTLLPCPLPISRIKSILFANKKSQENSKATAETFQDAYLPEHLFSIWDNNLPNYSEKISKSSFNEPTNIKDSQLQSKDNFDRVLGMFAFMKNADLYFANETNEFSNYSDKYFKALSLINSRFEIPEMGQLEGSIRPYYQALISPSKFGSDELDRIVKNIYAGEIFKKDIFKEILGQPSMEIQKAFTLLTSDETLKALQLLSNLKQPELILLAFLFRFRNKDGNDKYGLKDQITQLIDIKKDENKASNRVSMVLATLGLYYGYRSLPKEETISFSDNFYASLGTTHNIKFKLNSFLDRMTIESIYQFCFYGEQGSFNYLPNELNKPIYVNVPDAYEDKSFPLFDVTVLKFSKLQYKKVSIWDWLKKVFFSPISEIDLLERKDGSQSIRLPNGDVIEYKPYKK